MFNYFDNILIVIKMSWIIHYYLRVSMSLILLYNIEWLKSFRDFKLINVRERITKFCILYVQARHELQ